MKHRSNYVSLLVGLFIVGGATVAYGCSGSSDSLDGSAGPGGSDIADAGQTGAGGSGAGGSGAGGADAGPAVMPKGPLAGLPSTPGPQIATIKALADNEWLNLGAPKADPKWGRARGRSWGGRALVLAPDLRGAFFAGEGIHAFVKPDGHIMDDIWVYDINAHAWITVYPGTDTVNFNAQVKAGEILVDENGQYVDKEMQPFPGHVMIHAWDLLTYDPLARKFAFHSGPALSRYYLGGEMVMDEGLKILEEEKKTKPAPPMSPWFYDTAEGKFEKYAITKGQPPVGGFPYFQYVPTLKQFFLGGSTGIGFFDPAAKAWSDVEDQGPRPPGYDHGGCYDEKRDRIYMGNGVSDPTSPLFIYDIKLATWTNPTPIGTPPGAFRTNDASVAYDVVNDVVTVFHYKDKKIYTYVPGTNTWTNQPFPAAVLASVPYGSFSTFYDPELNAYFCYGASDSADNGVMWAYRYKQ